MEGSWWGKMATRESDIAAWESGVQQIEDQDMALAARALPGEKPPGLLLTPFYAEAQLILPLPRLPLSLGCLETLSDGHSDRTRPTARPTDSVTVSLYTCFQYY